VRFKVATALAAAALCAAVVSCSSGPAATASTQAPPVTVLTKGPDNGNGDIFLAPQGGQYGSGPEIVSITGKVLWSTGCRRARSPPTSAPRPIWASRC
jgi:hypothetical protein